MALWDIYRRRGLKGNVCISYPKSGRTWVRFALDMANAPVTYYHGGYATRDPAQLGYTFEGVRKAFFGNRNIFLHRSPIDTAVSEFYQIRNRIFTPTHPRFIEMHDRLAAANLLPPPGVDEFVLHPVWGCGKVSAFNRAHIEYFGKRGNAKLVRYEDLRADPAGQFSALLDFLGVRDYDIARIVEESSFEKMRQLEVAGDTQTRKKHALYGMRDNDENSLKVRRGKVNGYVDALRAETVTQARHICAEFGFEA